MKRITVSILLLSMAFGLQGREIHVAKSGNDLSDGSISSPLKTISTAAKMALPGDTVTVHEGVYREWVDPLRGGTSDKNRILYRAAEGEKVEIKGSEVVTGWKRDKKNKDIWTVSVPNTLFGDFNPFNEPFLGDWLDNKQFQMHLGDVYINEVSLYEAGSKDSLLVERRTPRDPDGVKMNWYATVDDDFTTIYAYFGGLDPNKETTEINVRPTCFYPTREGLGYITVRGFKISMAATQWGAPTAEQIGMIAPHWSKGWIIEDNIIKNSHASGITLGKEAGSGQDVFTLNPDRDGAVLYIEVIFRTLAHGWNKENIGSHIVRNNIISDCGQTGICGSMACAFSQITGNEIYNVCVKGLDQFNGAEIGGIKFHGALDVLIKGNSIHDCNQAIWLDWMAQGTRVSSNLFYNNYQQDIFLEMLHGPFVLDNNLFLSEYSLLDATEGGAFLHNFIYGKIRHIDWEDPRFVPYNVEHSTSIKGISRIEHSDFRFFNNIFCYTDGDHTWDLGRYRDSKHPSIIVDNVILTDPAVSLTDDGDKVKLTIEGLDPLPRNCSLVDGDRLGTVWMTGYSYENADGTPIRIDADYFGNKRPTEKLAAGPFETTPSKGVPVWTR